MCGEGETWLCIEGDRSASMHMCRRGIIKVGRETELECRRGGGGVASRRWWERPTRQTEGTTAISIREGMCVYVCVCM